MKKLLLLPLVALGLILVPAPANSVQPPDLHCTGHSDPVNTKIQANPDGSLDSIVLAAGTRFCVKGSTKESGLLIADGTTTLKVYLGSFNQNNQLQSVSYYVVYPPLPISISVCLDGNVTVFGPGLKATVDAQVAAFIAANPTATLKGEGDCPTPTTTTTQPTTPTTVIVEKVVEVPVPGPTQVVEITRTVEVPVPTAPPAPAPAQELPKTGAGTLLTLIGAGLTGSGMIIRRLFK